MKVIILNSAPGVGKTVLLKILERKLPKGFAVIDGDDVGRIAPLRLSMEWLNLIQDNIVSCAKNFKEFGIECLVISFVFPSKNRLDRVTTLLMDEGMDTVSMLTLYCDETELRERIQRRNTSKIIDVERAIELNKQIKDMSSKLFIDTTKLDPDEVSNVFCNMILDTNLEDV